MARLGYHRVRQRTCLARRLAHPIEDDFVGSATFLLEIATADLEGTERRHGQESMAESVASAIDSGRHLVIQAGTGTGKTLAYLVPVLASGKTTVIATVTKALQDQLATKDLPHACAALKDELGREPSWAVLKGRSNYLCLQRLDEERDGPELPLAEQRGNGREARILDELLQWSTFGVDGDLDRYPRSLGADMRRRVTVTPDECPGASKCPRGQECFAERARRRAAESAIIVVNTHLYGLHLMSDGQLLPEHDVVVIDEAHQLEDVISDVASASLSPRRLLNLAGTVAAVVSDERLRSEFLRAADRLLIDLVPRLDKRISIDNEPALVEVLGFARAAADSALAALGRVEQGRSIADEATRQKLLRATLETTRFVDTVDRFLAGGPQVVLFAQGPADRPSLMLAPLQVDRLLRATLWSQHTAILTSATIPRNLTKRIGLEDSEVTMLDVGSPFSYDEQGLLYCPVTIADPRSDRRSTAVDDELSRLISAAGGRTLALFTTIRAMRQHAESMAKKLEYRIYVQDDMPRSALIEAFENDETSCLFATSSFFQGIDIPGRTLSLVVIDKIPFPRPDDPLLEARRDVIGKGAFGEIDLPHAATMLAQAAGRLIRTTTDRGVVAVLDPRLATKPYGSELVATLPPFKRTKQFDEVADFLAQVLR